jgi:hypothetical protein
MVVPLPAKGSPTMSAQNVTPRMVVSSSSGFSVVWCLFPVRLQAMTLPWH